MGKFWKVEVSELGGSEPLFLGNVEAATWPAALQSGRKEIGESGGVPPGASCNVNPNGTVTIQDARGRRRYQIVPVKEPAPPPGTKPPLPSRNENPVFSSNEESPLPLRRETSPPPPARSPEPAGALPRTLRKRTPQPSSPPPATVENKLILVSSRDQGPTSASPLHFRERMFAVPVPLQTGTGEKLAMKLLRRVQDELRQEHGAKFVRIELFDHVWRSAPERAAVVRLEWKDWTATIDIEFPFEEELRRSDGAAASSAPPPSPEDRLSAAFEACHDLLFLRNRAEALDFSVRLLEELVLSKALAAYLLDVNTDELRVVAARGTGARERRGRGFPSSAGLLGAAGTLAEHAVLVLADAPADPRYDPGIDGVPGMDVRALLYRPLIHKGRLFGVLQLANDVGGPVFSEADCEVVDYVTQQLSVFVARGASIPPMAAGE